MKTKGITDIIAIVLLLMITISMVGFAWIWMQRLTLNVQNSTLEQVDTLSNISGQQVRIDNIDASAGNGRLTIRNVGFAATSVNYISIYANSSSLLTLTDCGASWANTIIQPGATAICNSTKLVGCSSVKVTTSAGVDSRDC